MRLENQPHWPDGEAPIEIRSIRGGFVDGAGVEHAAPYGVTAARLEADGWHWVAPGPSDPPAPVPRRFA